MDLTPNSSQELQPASAFRNAAVRATVSFLKSHPGFRLLLGVAGAGLFLIGVVAAPFWNIELLSWLKAGEVAAVCIGGGLGALGLWYLSRPPRAAANPVVSGSEAANRPDVARQLKELAELHSSGALTEEEFSQAKARVLR